MYVTRRYTKVIKFTVTTGIRAVYELSLEQKSDLAWCIETFGPPGDHLRWNFSSNDFQFEVEYWFRDPEDAVLFQLVR